MMGRYSNLIWSLARRDHRRRGRGGLEHADRLRQGHSILRRAPPMKSAVLKIGIDPLEVPAGIEKVAIGELAVHKDHIVQMEAFPLKILVLECFHLYLLLPEYRKNQSVTLRSNSSGSRPKAPVCPAPGTCQNSTTPEWFFRMASQWRKGIL